MHHGLGFTRSGTVRTFWAAIFVAAALAGNPVSAADTTPSAKAPQGYFVAGLKPAQRPAGAPTINKPAYDGNWMAKALMGVSQPIPASLGFLSSQGNWYTPFNRPGMTSPYDVRGWHG